MHECEEFVSQCCGAGRHEYVDTICAQCNDHTGFECIECSILEHEELGFGERLSAMSYKDVRELQNIIQGGN